jgi:hypothetical protein
MTDKEINELANQIEALEPDVKKLVNCFLDLLIAFQKAGVEPTQIENSLNRAAMRAVAGK